MSYQEQAKEIIDILSTIDGNFRKEPVVKISKGECKMLVQLSRNNGSMMAGELAKCVCVTTARMTAMIKVTEDKGLVTREQVENDRRKIKIVLTDKGHKLMKEMYEDAINNTALYLEALGPEDTDNLVRIIKKTKDIFNKEGEKQ